MCGSQSKMSNVIDPVAENGAANDKAGLDFYFGRPTEMMRKLETSKPVRRTKVDNKKSGQSEGGNSTGELGEAQGGYLFKWQREADEDQEEEDEDVAVDQATRSRARWQLVTGNLPPSSLSVGAYFEKDGPKGKPLRDGLVNAGGVIMIQPGTTMKGGGKLNLGELSLLNETGKGLFFHDDNVLSLRSKDEVGGDLDRPSEEKLVFRRGTQWPPEAPGFPPPPPDGNELVHPKRVPIVSSHTVRRMSRMRPLENKQTSFRGIGNALMNTPENSAAEVGAPSQRALELSRVSDGSREVGSLSRTKAPSNLAVTREVVKPVSKDPKQKEQEKKGFLRRISFMPGLGGRKDDSSAFPGVYATYVVVPYMLPPPPQPPKFPAPGSNDERKLQKQNLKRMFLEDMYSQIVELALEKIRLNEVCRDLEAQITDSDAQINMLIGANDQ